MKIVLNGPVAHAGAAILRHRIGPAAQITEVDHRAANGRAASALAEADVLVSVDFHARMPPLPRARLLHVPAAGLDALDLAAVPEGCRVCNVFEHEIGISEYVMAAMLHVAVDLAGRSARFKVGSWEDSPRLGAPFRPELAGRTLGSIGYGHIGRAVACRAKAFGMRVMAIARTPRELEPAPDWLGDPAQLPALLEDSDFVLVACPLNEETRGLIGADALARMKPTAYLVNTARGPIVDTDALIGALERGEIAGAALDVTDPEPLPGDHPLLGAPNLLVLPHLGSATVATRERMADIAVDNLLAALDGERMPHCANPEVYG
jgi:phosphoglycerate dehydrogenase-like enzyme